MTTSARNLPAGGSHSSARPLWAAIVVLGVAVLLLGAGLIHVQTRPVRSDAVSTPADTAPPAASPHPAPLATPKEPETAHSRLPVTTVAPGEAVLSTRAAPAAPTSARVPPAAPTDVAVPDRVVNSRPAPPPWPLALPLPPPLPLPSPQPQMQQQPAPTPAPRNYGLERN